MWESFGFAGAGLWYALRTQRNLRIHLLISYLALSLAALLHLSTTAMVSLFFIITVVMVAEVANTAIETVVDLATREEHPLAKRAKDVAAGAVLLAAINAVVAGGILFVPRLPQVPDRFLFWLRHRPQSLLLLAGGFLVLLVWMLVLDIRQRRREREAS